MEMKEIFDIVLKLYNLFNQVGGTLSNAQTLEKMVETLKKEGIPAVNTDKIPEEHWRNLEKYCEQHKKEIFSGQLFSEADKQAFCENYFQETPSAYANRDEIKCSLYRFLEDLDNYLCNNMSVGEQAIFQKLMELSKLLTPTPPPEPSVHTANQTYTNAFQEILFLHNKDKDREAVKDVTLANLYVKPRYQGVGFPSRNLSARLQRFVAEDKQHFLLIEGNAGTGKTTLVEWLNYHNWKQTPEVMNLLNGRPLVTIRLRDMKYETLKGGLLSAIQIYLGKGTPIPDEQFVELLDTALFVLDGFDELCTIDGITKPFSTLEDFSDYFSDGDLSQKVIVTSRPNYIRSLPTGWSRLALLPFDQKQREEWLDNYQTKCKQAVAPHIETYIRSLSDEEEENNSIFTAPMTLYMVVAKAPDEAELNNEWRLYHAIFYEEIRDTRYNQTTKRQLNTKKVHPAKKYWDIFYQINEEIAYRMYQTGNSRLYVNSDEVKGIIKELSERSPELKEQMKDSTTQAIVQRCHALCGYWKLNSDQGFLEFYHNDIRDFFLCEKLFRAVNDLYDAKKWNARANVVKLVELFQYSAIEEQVLNFIKQRASLSKPEETERPSFCDQDFPGLEYARKKEEKRFPAMFQELMTDGMLFFEVESTREDCPGLRTRNPLKSVEITTSSMMNVYNRALVPLLFEKEYLPLFVDIPSVNENGLWKGLMNGFSRYCFLERTDLSGVDLRGADLRHVNLIRANLNYAELSGADLRSADLYCADLYHADLHHAELNDAELSYAILSDVDLRGADLSDADLSGVDLRYAVLSGATLPDRFRSLYQEEQIEHLKSLNIKGLIL